MKKVHPKGSIVNIFNDNKQYWTKSPTCRRLSKENRAKLPAYPKVRFVTLICAMGSPFCPDQKKACLCICKNRIATNYKRQDSDMWPHRDFPNSSALARAASLLLSAPLHSIMPASSAPKNPTIVLYCVSIPA